MTASYTIFILWIFTCGTLSSGGSLSQPVLFVPPPPTPKPICAIPNSHLVGDKCIVVHDSEVSWDEAENKCSEIGCRLLEIVTGQEYFDLISALRTNGKRHTRTHERPHQARRVKEKGRNEGKKRRRKENEGLLYNSYWVGACKRGPFTSWCWATECLPIQETFWAVTFVNGKPKKEPLESYSNCGLLDASRSHFLNADRCEAPHRFICQGAPVTPEPLVLEPGCREGWAASGEGRCYRAFEQQVTFQKASALCQAQAARLVSITSEEENQVVRDLIEAGPAAYYWIGLERTFLRFRWTDGSEYFYNNWFVGEPDFNVRFGKSCTGISSSSGEWRANYCTVVAGYVCEQGAA